MRKNTFIRLQVIMACLLIQVALFGQRYLQIETINDPETIKIEEGETISYKLKESEDWITAKISQFLPKEDAIIMEDSYVRLEDITHIMRYRPFANYIGKGLMTFGAGWLVYGGIAAIGADFDFGGDTLVIGVGSIAIGWLFRKLFYKKPLTLGKRYRLRLLDLRLE